MEYFRSVCQVICRSSFISCMLLNWVICDHIVTSNAVICWMLVLFVGRVISTTERHVSYFGHTAGSYKSCKSRFIDLHCVFLKSI